MYKREFQCPHRKKVPNTHKDEGTNLRRNGGNDQKFYRKKNIVDLVRTKGEKANTHTHTHTQKEE